MTEQSRPMGVRVHPGGPSPTPWEPETFEEALADVHRRYCTAGAHDPVCRILSYSETDVRTEWAVDATSKPKIGGIVAFPTKGDACALGLEYDLPVLQRRVYIIRRAGDWGPA